MTDTPWSERVRLWAHNLDRSDDTRPTVPFTRAACIEALNELLGRHGLRLVGAPEAAVLDEALTPEDREDIEADIRDAFAFHQTGRGDPPNVSAVIAAKLLRIHDRQAARIEELERAAEYADQCALERSERE